MKPDETLSQDFVNRMVGHEVERIMVNAKWRGNLEAEQLGSAMDRQKQGLPPAPEEKE